MGCSPPGSAGVPPAQHWQGLAHLLDRVDRQRRQDAASADPMPFPSAGWGRCHIAGKLSGRQRECMRAGRPRSRVAPLPIALAPRGGVRRLAGPQPCRCGRVATLRGPSWITLFSFVSGKRLPPENAGYLEAVFRNALSSSLLIPEIPSRSTPRPSFQASKPMTMDPMSTRLRMVGVGTPNWLPTEAQAPRP